MSQGKLLCILLLVGYIILPPIQLRAQKLLQLEIFREVEAVKFGEGSVITFKTVDFPKDWQTKKIERIITEENLIILEDGMLPLKNIYQFRIYNNTAKAFGKLLTGFGAGWFLFGGIAHFASGYQFTVGNFVVGGVALGIGWLLNKIVSKKTYTIGKTANLRIIDISFPKPRIDMSNDYP
jgi:hypothetical protein